MFDQSKSRPGCNISLSLITRAMMLRPGWYIRRDNCFLMKICSPTVSFFKFRWICNMFHEEKNFFLTPLISKYTAWVWNMQNKELILDYFGNVVIAWPFWWNAKWTSWFCVARFSSGDQNNVMKKTGGSTCFSSLKDEKFHHAAFQAIFGKRAWEQITQSGRAQPSALPVF